MRNLFLVSFLWGISQFIQVSTGQQLSWDVAPNSGVSLGVGQGGTLRDNEQTVLEGILRGILTNNQGNYQGNYQVGGASAWNENLGGGGQLYQDNQGGAVAGSQSGLWNGNLGGGQVYQDNFGGAAAGSQSGLWNGNSGGGQIYQDYQGGAVAGSQSGLWNGNSGGQAYKDNGGSGGGAGSQSVVWTSGLFGNQGNAQGGGQFVNQGGAQGGGQFVNQGGVQGGGQFVNQRSVQGGGQVVNPGSVQGGGQVVNQGAPSPVFNGNSQILYSDTTAVSQANVQNTNAPPGQAYPLVGSLFTNKQANVQNAGPPMVQDPTQNSNLVPQLSPDQLSPDQDPSAVISPLKTLKDVRSVVTSPLTTLKTVPFLLTQPLQGGIAGVKNVGLTNPLSMITDGSLHDATKGLLSKLGGIQGISDYLKNIFSSLNQILLLLKANGLDLDSLGIADKLPPSLRVLLDSTADAISDIATTGSLLDAAKGLLKQIGGLPEVKNFFKNIYNMMDKALQLLNLMGVDLDIDDVLPPVLLDVLYPDFAEADGGDGDDKKR